MCFRAIVVLDAIRCHHSKTAVQPLPDGSDDSELPSEEDEPVIRTHIYTEEAVRPQYTIRYTPTQINADKQIDINYGQVYMYTHTVFCLGRFQRAGRPAAFWWRPAIFKKLKWRPVFFWWRPMTPCYNFYFPPNVTVRGNRRGNYACVPLFYSTAFVIVIRLVYKNLCYWPIRIYFGMLATDCCITFTQWKARTQELLSRVRDVR